MLLQKPVYKWYAIYTKANNEKKVFDLLKEEDIECYLPLKKTLRQWSDRKKWIDVPLFRCYVFVKVSHIEFFSVLKIPGVVYYVSFGGEPQSIPDYQIDFIKTIVQEKEQELEINYENVKKGTECEVLVGPLKGIKGEVVRLNGQYRLYIRIVSMGCSLHVNISRDEIKLIKNKTTRTAQKRYSSLDRIPYRKRGVTVN